MLFSWVVVVVKEDDEDEEEDDEEDDNDDEQEQEEQEPVHARTTPRLDRKKRFRSAFAVISGAISTARKTVHSGASSNISGSATASKTTACLPLNSGV